MADRELTKRVAVAAVGIPLVVVALVLGRWVLGPLLALLAAGAALEFYRLSEQRGVRPLTAPGALGAASLVLIATARPTLEAATPLLWTAIVLLTLLLALGAIWTRGVEGQPLLAVSVTVAGALLPGASLGYGVFLRELPSTAGADAGGQVALLGAALVAYPLAVTWMTDSAAFFAGKRWGRRKLIPSVSPGKTVVGAVAGLIGGVLGGWIMARWVIGAWLGVGLDPLAGAVGGLLVAVVSQMGDLAESAWKREAGVKDSGALFPGHGGILDRLDSLLFAIPTAYALLALFLPGSPGW